MVRVRGQRLKGSCPVVPRREDRAQAWAEASACRRWRSAASGVVCSRAGRRRRSASEWNGCPGAWRRRGRPARAGALAGPACVRRRRRGHGPGPPRCPAARRDRRCCGAGSGAHPGSRRTCPSGRHRPRPDGRPAGQRAGQPLGYSKFSARMPSTSMRGWSSWPRQVSQWPRITLLARAIEPKTWTICSRLSCSTKLRWRTWMPSSAAAGAAGETSHSTSCRPRRGRSPRSAGRKRGGIHVGVLAVSMDASLRTARRGSKPMTVATLFAGRQESPDRVAGRCSARKSTKALTLGCRWRLVG